MKIIETLMQMWMTLKKKSQMYHQYFYIESHYYCYILVIIKWTGLYEI